MVGLVSLEILDLSVEMAESQCDDEIDNDNDGLLDCDDDDCLSIECVTGGSEV